jgi:hypothetical protein
MAGITSIRVAVGAEATDAAVSHLGAVGAGRTAKLRSRLACAVDIAVVCEIAAPGGANGVCPKHTGAGAPSAAARP